jgi:L-seryl-tRNA(Ser) seleniumtransferase
VPIITSLRDLPAVDKLVASLGKTRLPQTVTVDLVRSALDVARSEIQSEGGADPEAIARDLLTSAHMSRSTRVLNATGVLLHTNLGRSPLSRKALDAMSFAAGRYTNLEIDLSTGHRGGRGSYVLDLLRTLTGAEDALVVNNNAAALLLALAATSEGKAVPVARGELIEIGGSYRLPDVMAASGAQLVEVGTTNRTRIGDFVTAVQLHTVGAILKVHPSNYRVEGFTEEASLADLAGLADGARVPLIHDVGSGLLDKEASWLTSADGAWLTSEPAVRQSLERGAEIVTFSGDKLLGGPQAGIIVGSRGAISKLRSHPLARALRIDGATGAGLASTLESYAEGRADEIPFWRMAHLTDSDLRERLGTIREETGGDVRDGVSLIGAGSVPGVGIPTPQLVLVGADDLYLPLLRGEVAVATRRQHGDLLIDLRAVEEADDATLTEMVIRCR